MTGRVMARDRSRLERRRLLRLLELQDRERRLVAYDIHDGFVQDVVGAQLAIDGMLDRLAKTDPDCVPALLRVRNLVRKAIEDARQVVRELRPTAVEGKGLVESIQSLVSEVESLLQLEVKFTFSDFKLALAPLLVATLTRIVQESLNNIHRHANTRNAEVRLSWKREQIRLEIEDHGDGFDVKAVDSARFGLAGIRERASVFGGKATIRSKPGMGTSILVVVPAKRKRPSKKKRKGP